MIFSQIANPNPVPSPIFFVVKKGSKILFFDSSVIPIPVSVTAISSHLPSFEEEGRGAGRVLIVSTPPLGMASSALVIRLRKSVWRCVGSPRIGREVRRELFGQFHVSGIETRVRSNGSILPELRSLSRDFNWGFGCRVKERRFLTESANRSSCDSTILSRS